MLCYLDTSVALYAMLPSDADTQVVHWLRASGSEGRDICSSTLLGLEVARVLRREGLGLDRARPVLELVNQVSIDDGVLRIAAGLESQVKPLDAIHLATCSLLGRVTVVTHDATMSRAAVELGYDTFDPLVRFVK